MPPLPDLPEDNTMAGWEHFAHGADIGVAGYGPTLSVAFEQAALALTAVITDQPVEARERVEVACAAPDVDYLLIEWLNAIVFEMATRQMLFGGYEVKIEDHELRGVLRGEPLDVKRHEPAVEVKGATYTALSVLRDASGRWVARCVVDV